MEERGTSATRAEDACFVLFGGNTDALSLFDALKERGMDARIAPTPREARATCGTSLLVNCDDWERIEGVALELAIPIERIVALPRQIDPSRDRFC